VVKATQPERAESPLQAPWNPPEWWKTGQRAGRDPGLDRVLRRFGGGRPSSAYASPLSMTTPFFANPYINVTIAVFSVGFASFMGVSLRPPVAGIVFGGLVGAIALFVAVLSLWQIPKWHRLRHVAKVYLARHPGGKMPPELRWYQ
jgi:hypothetical protein